MSLSFILQQCINIAEHFEISSRTQCLEGCPLDPRVRVHQGTHRSTNQVETCLLLGGARSEDA
jgi:hypothetical protein